MSYRRRNFQLDTPPPGPIPRTPKIEKITPGDSTAIAEWSYPSNAIEVDHWDLELLEGAALLAVLRIEGPATRSHTLGELTNGVKYGLQIQAVNLNGRSDYSNRMEFTPKALDIPVPVLGSVTGWDAFITFSFTCDTPPGPIDAVHYIAKRTDSGYETAGVAIMATQRSGSTQPIDNDREYQIYLALEIAGNIGPYSQASTPVTPTNPVPPFVPLWVHIDVDKQGDKESGSTSWKLTIAQGAKERQADSGPANLTGFRYEITAKATGTLICEGDKPTSFSPVDLLVSGPWVDGFVTMSLWARNKDGESLPAVIDFDTDPHGELPIDFGVFEEFAGYRYHYAQDDVKALAKVTKRGIGVPLEVMVIGAGGCGQGRTTLGAQGGQGGSGEVICTTVKPVSTGSITAKIGDGASYLGTAPGGYSYVTIVDGQQIIARGGGNASGKTDGAPSYLTPAVSVDTLMNGASKLRIWVWNMPRSTMVGGSVIWDKNNAPNADLYAQGGGGTNGSGANHGGSGAPGVVVIRYKIGDVPAQDPELSRRQKFTEYRLQRKIARQVRRAS